MVVDVVVMVRARGNLGANFRESVRVTGNIAWLARLGLDLGEVGLAWIVDGFHL